MQETTTQDVERWLSSIDVPIDTRKPWQQLPCCPGCGNEKSFAILVKKSESRPDTPLGTYSCLSNNCVLGKGSFSHLLAQLGLHGVRKALPGRVAARSTEEADGHALENEQHALVSNPEVMAYLLKEFGLSREDVLALGLGAKRTKDGPWLSIPYYVGERLHAVKYRVLPGNETTRGKFFMHPAGKEQIPYGINSIRKLDDPSEFGFIVEGESDAWTLRRLFGHDTAILGIPGIKALKEAAVEAIRKYPPREFEGTTQPRWVVIPDNAESGADMGMADDLARRVGGNFFYVCKLPKPSEGENWKLWKDVRAWAMRGGWGAKEFADHITENRTRMGSAEYIHASTVADSMSKSEVCNDKGLRWHVPKMDKYLEKQSLVYPHLPAGRISVLSGPRKHRKTSLCTYCTYRSAAIDDQPGCFDSWEMPREDIAELMFIQIFRRYPTVANWGKDMQALRSKLATCGYYFSDGKRKTLDAWEKWAETGVRNFGWKWIVVDSMTHICGTGDESRAAATAWGARMKDLAGAMKIHVMVLAHSTPQEGNDMCRKPLGTNTIRYFKDLANVVDYSWINQCLDRAQDGKDTPAISNCGLFQFSLGRATTGGPTELLWDKFQVPHEHHGAFFQGMDLDPEIMATINDQSAQQGADAI